MYNSTYDGRPEGPVDAAGCRRRRRGLAVLRARTAPPRLGKYPTGRSRHRFTTADGVRGTGRRPSRTAASASARHWPRCCCCWRRHLRLMHRYKETVQKCWRNDYSNGAITKTLKPCRHLVYTYFTVIFKSLCLCVPFCLPINVCWLISGSLNWIELYCCNSNLKSIK